MGAAEYTRREENAQATRLTIVEEARRLFIARGYFAVTVKDIASAARVTPKTVHVAAGGKQGVLTTLADSWAVTPEVGTSLQAMTNLTNPREVLRLVGATVAEIFAIHGDVIIILLNAATHSTYAAEVLRSREEGIAAQLQSVAEYLDGHGWLRDTIDVGHATEVLRFYFGTRSYTELRKMGWSPPTIASWLTAQAAGALLGDELANG